MINIDVYVKEGNLITKTPGSKSLAFKYVVVHSYDPSGPGDNHFVEWIDEDFFKDISDYVNKEKMSILIEKLIEDGYKLMNKKEKNDVLSSISANEAKDLLLNNLDPEQEDV